MKDTHARSIIKAISWRTTGTIFTFLISYLIIGSMGAALSISMADFLIKVVLYWIHERVWLNIRWGVK